MRFGNLLVRLLLSSLWHNKKNRKKLVRGGLAGIVFIVVLNVVVSCYYYQVTATNQPSKEELNEFSSLNKKFVIHQEYTAYYVAVLTFEGDSVKLLLGPSYLSEGQNLIPNTPKTVKRYRPKKGDARLLNEIHLHVNENVQKNEKTWMVAISDIERLDVYNHSTKHTTSYSILFGFAMIPAAYIAVTLLFFLVMALSGNSCPFIYTFNGEEFVFAGEIYSGAVYPPMERHDYLYLPDLVEENDIYQLKIANQLEEEQHTNLLELMVFDHTFETEILVDKYGKPHTISERVLPSSAFNLKGEDVLPLMAKEDDLIYVGNDPSKDPHLLDGMILTFEKSLSTDHAKLVIEAKNTYWLDFVYQNFREMLGSSYKMWVKKQQNGDPKKMTDWSLSQHIPLSVYLLKDGEWVFQDYFHTVGPMAFKKDILELDLNGLGDGPISIKMETGAYFWEIGYVGLDCTPDAKISMKTVQLIEASDETGESVKEQLLLDDDHYYIQPEIGNEANLSFPVPEKAEEERTVILHSKGYYQILQDPKGVPKIKALKEIRKSGQFNNYSNELMQAMLAEHMFQNEKRTK